MAVWSPSYVAHEEEQARNEMFSKQEFTAVTTVRVPWNERLQFAASVLGEDGGGGQSYPDNPFAIPTRIVIVPAPGQVTSGDDIEVASYEEALVTIYYSQSGQAFTETLEVSAENRIDDYRNFQWGSDAEGTAINPKEAPGTQILNFLYTCQWKRQAELPVEFEYAGSVNEFEMTLPNMNQDSPWFIQPECGLLFPRNAVRNAYRGVDGELIRESWDYGFSIKMRADGVNGVGQISWNKFYRLETKEYEPMYQKTPGGIVEYKSFPVANYTALLPPAD
jgi:hypothetical protein